jgi:hypothetical protein
VLLLRNVNALCQYIAATLFLSSNPARGSNERRCNRPHPAAKTGLPPTFKYLVRKHLQAKTAGQRANCSCAFSECQPATTSTGSRQKRKACFAKMGNLKSTGAKPFEPRLVSKRSFPSTLLAAARAMKLAGCRSQRPRHAGVGRHFESRVGAFSRTGV